MSDFAMTAALLVSLLLILGSGVWVGLDGGYAFLVQACR